MGGAKPTSSQPSPPPPLLSSPHAADSLITPREKKRRCPKINRVGPKESGQGRVKRLYSALGSHGFATDNYGRSYVVRTFFLATLPSIAMVSKRHFWALFLPREAAGRGKVFSPSSLSFPPRPPTFIGGGREGRDTAWFCRHSRKIIPANTNSNSRVCFVEVVLRCAKSTESITMVFATFHISKYI